jgi:hypothetical protein
MKTYKFSSQGYCFKEEVTTELRLQRSKGFFRLRRARIIPGKAQRNGTYSFWSGQNWSGGTECMD